MATLSNLTLVTQYLKSLEFSHLLRIQSLFHSFFLPFKMCKHVLTNLFFLSYQYWFQNRRAKSRRGKSHQAQEVVSQVILSNELKRPVTFSHSVQFPRHTTAVSDVADIRIERVWSKAGKDPRDQPRFQPRVIKDYCPREPYLNDQLRSKLQMEFGLPMFHPDQLKNRIQADPTKKRRYSRSSKRPKPY